MDRQHAHRPRKGDERKQVVQSDRQSRLRTNPWDGLAKGKSNAGACGVDCITVGHFSKDSQNRLLAVKEQLREGRYQPKPIRRVHIPKPGSNEQRPLGIPTVTDRVVQGAVKLVIEPIFERAFATSSYGFRPGRGCKDALRAVERLLAAGQLPRRRPRHQRLLRQDPAPSLPATR